MDKASKLDEFFRNAEQHGSWANYAVYCLGNCDSGDDGLDQAIENLYLANERVHFWANKLALRYEVPFFEEKMP